MSDEKKADDNEVRRVLGTRRDEGRIEKGSYEHTTPRENTNETRDRPGKR